MATVYMVTTGSGGGGSLQGEEETYGDTIAQVRADLAGVQRK